MLKISTVLAVAWCVWVFGDRYLSTRRWQQLHQPAASQGSTLPPVFSGSAVKILSFYARDAGVTEGSSTVLCYGVLNAKSVKIEPPVEGATPAINRCLEISPSSTTRYTLTAEGDDGRVTSASFVLPVQPDPEALPEINTFKISRRDVRNGVTTYTVHFFTRNAVQVSLEPPAFAPTSAPFGFFSVAPRETTTYTLTVTGKKGRTAKKQLTIQVP